MATRYEHEIPEGYEARIEGGKVIIELKESEDERIRKDIVTYLRNELHNIAQLTPRTNEIERWIAYLEKQREQKPVDLVAELKHHLATTPKEQLEKEWKELEPFGFGPTVEEYLYGKPEKPQWSEEDERMRQTAIEACKTVAEDYENSNARFYKCKDWLEYRLKSIHPQSKQEWSEEEEKFLQVAISCTFERGYLSVSNWLKSLRPQPKQEWSEEDEDYLRDVKCAVYDYFDEGYAEELCDWLRPHWKPSEKQMEALDNAQGELCSTEYSQQPTTKVRGLDKE